jgi:RNA polymerase sigma-70 factor (ECF subfamily)
MASAEVTRTLELVRQAQTGDRASLERLFERYYDRVRRIVRIRLGARLRRDFDSGDILQDAFAVAVRKFDEFEIRDEASFISWMRTIVERQITDKVDWQAAASRNRAREVATVGTDEPEAAVHEPAAASTAPLDRLLEDEGRRLVELHLTQLDAKYRDLILLRDYEGHSWDRIAELTGRPTPDAARMMYAKALVELGSLVRGQHRRPPG